MITNQFIKEAGLRACFLFLYRKAGDTLPTFSYCLKGAAVL